MVGGVYMKNYCFPFLSVLVLLGAAACGKQADPVAPVPEETPEPAVAWKVSVPAGKGGDATKALEYDTGTGKVLTSFETTDVVYVYNKTTATLDAGTLAPDANAASVNLVGTLMGSYTEGDELELRYGSYWSTPNGVFDYEEQTGTFETLRDFGVAEVKVTTVDAVNQTLTLEDAHFTNPYSIFKFTFVDAETSAPIPIDELFIKTVWGKLVFKDSPDGSANIMASLPTEGPLGKGPWVIPRTRSGCRFVMRRPLRSRKRTGWRLPFWTM